MEYEQRGLVILAVNFGDKAETVRAYFDKERFTMTPVLQKDNTAGKAFGVQIYPTSFVLGPDGRIAWRAAGFDESALRSALESIMPGK